MTVRATMQDGSEVTLAADQGRTVAEIEQHMIGDHLTGSAAILGGATLRTAAGDVVAYSDINKLTETEAE